MLGPSWLSRGLLALTLAALAAPVLLLPGGGPEAQAGITPVAATAARDKGRPLDKTFNVRLERHGYTTGFIGKYMNRYEAVNSNGTMLAPRPVPGWSEFEAILGGGYNGWGFLSTRLTGDDRVALDEHPRPTHVGGNCGAKACSRLMLRDLKGYGDPRGDNAPTYLRRDGRTRPAPPWQTNDVLLSDEAALSQYRDRARMVQSVDRLLARVRDAVGPNTYVVLTSDNDTRVPLVVTGPDVVPGRRTQFVNNIDLAPTFEQLGGLRPSPIRSGTGFAPTLRQPEARGGRYAFFEHTYARSTPGEVDLDMGSGGTIDIIPSFIAVRGEAGLLVRLDLDQSWSGTDYAWELYRYDRPWEDVNVFAADHDTPWARDLMRRLHRWEGCTPAQCRAAAR
jgi:hypothetical protein